MQFKGQEISALTLKELQDADWELGGVEYNYLESLQNKRLQAMKPKPEMNPSFKALRDEIKQEIKKRKE